MKTVFLHVSLPQVIYCKVISGFSLPDASPEDNMIIVDHVIYGLYQSSHKFYILLYDILEDLGLKYCEVDHVVFYGYFLTSPDSSISTLSNADPLIIIMLVHVDDGLVAINSLPLYY